MTRGLMKLQIVWLAFSVVACGSGNPASDGGPPDGGDSGDTGVSDAAAEASADAAAPDGDASSQPGACGSTFCRGGQVCVAGACVYQGCQGTTVPGDYAKVQDAVTAVQGVGGTICIGAGTFAEDVTITAQAQKNLTIIGVSASQTALKSLDVTETGTANATITIEGISVSNGAKASFDGTVVFDNCDIAAPAGNALAITAGSSVSLVANVSNTKVTNSVGSALACVVSSGALDLTVTACDLSAKVDALNHSMSSGAATIVVRDSYVHDSAYGIDLNGVSATNGAVSADVTGNTIVRNQTGLAWYGPAKLTYFDNVIANNTQYGVLLGQGNVPSSQFGNNALYGNAANYSGFATDGTGYVKADPMLDSSTPPGLKPGSPCRGAGEATHASKTDYWGHTRGPSIDIGCIQMP